MGKQVTHLAVFDHENGLFFYYFSFAATFLDPFSLLGFRSVIFNFYKFRLLMAIHGSDVGSLGGLGVRRCTNKRTKVVLMLGVCN
ncbi:hypothetical protein ACE6H2_011006 [Prunus campanulata]